jgi:hypothetical protein
MNDELKQAIASLLQDPNKRDAVAEMIVEYVQPQHVTSDLVNMLISTRSLKPGDSLVKKLRKGIRVHTLVPGAIHLASEVTQTDRITHLLDGADVKVTWNEWEMESGEIGTIDEIRNEMYLKLRDFYYGKLLTALSSVWSATNTPNNFTNVGGAITATALENAIDVINQTTSGVKAVVGVRSAMTPITKFGAFHTDGTNVAASQTALDEIMRTGRLGTYYGAPLVVVDQVYDNPADYNPLLPADKIIVIGENVGEFITFGEVKTKQYTDMRPTPPQWFLELYQQFGLMIWNAQGIHVLGGLS